MLEEIGRGAQQKGRWGNELEAGTRFLASLRPEDLRSCPYHNLGWKRIADASALILQSMGRRDPDAYVAEAKKTRFRARDKDGLISLFDDPVTIEGGRYVNGQHRSCALRFSGAERAAVVVDSEVLSEVPADWVYLGNG
jgi:hypothetical protein